VVFTNAVIVREYSCSVNGIEDAADCQGFKRSSCQRTLHATVEMFEEQIEWLVRWAGLDEIKNRGRFPGHAVAGHGHGIRQNGLVSIDLDAIHEVADERLPLGDRPILQEVPEVRHVLHYLLGVGQGNPALLNRVSASSLAASNCSFRCLRDMIRGDRTSNVSSLVSMAS